MKRIVILSLIIAMNGCVYADSINSAAYKTMQMQAYRQNRYRTQRQVRQIPYWQAQSNYSTRNKIYNNSTSTRSSGYSQYYYRGR